MTAPIDRLTATLVDRYRIERELGAGGMATVYLAHDLKHARDVAIKVLHPDLGAALGGERFLAEIRTTARLQHPHILPLLDSGEADGLLFYVMPLVTGETLRARLEREQQLPVADAVQIAREVADALGHAHALGVIHRDIKPENILLQGGHALVADFGIALAVQSAGGQRMTQTGLSLGTPQYMSPEQAMGERTVDARSDIYALGAVTYEMLAGEPPFTGPTVQAIVARLLSESPRGLGAQRKSVPEHVEAAVLQALEKLPADRFDSATAFAAALGNPQHGLGTRDPPSMGPAGRGPRGRRWGGLGWAVGAAGLAVGAWALQATRMASDEQRRAQHLNIVLPDSAPLSFMTVGGISSGATALAMSPDGETVVYVARTEGTTRLYRRDLDGFVATPIDGTDGAFNPVVSPDGEWTAFLAGAELRKVPMRGGTPVSLASVSEVSGIDWAPDGRILVAAREGVSLGWVPQAGGALEPIPNPQGRAWAQPNILPGVRYALVETILGGIPSVVAAVELETGRAVALTLSGPVAIDSVDPASVIRGQQPRFLASGHLVYTTPAGLRAITFDPVSLQLSGTAVEVLDGIRSASEGTQYAVSSDGTLVYAPGEDADRGALVWASRDGSVDSVGVEPQRYGMFSLSPDGRRLVATVLSPIGAPELWVYDLEQGTHSRMVTRGTPVRPIWWPDGRRVVFTERSPGASAPLVAVRQLVESAGERDTLTVGYSLDDIADDTLTALGDTHFATGTWIVSLRTPPQAPVPIDSFPTAWGGAYSPDQRWIAYTSNEAGQYDIYVTNVARRSGRRKVSLAGGEEPVWSPRGDELFYRWGQDWYAVPVPTSDESAFGRPQAIFRGQYVNVPWRSHDVSPDGRRHLVIRGPRAQSAGHLNVITHWTEVVRQRLRR